MIKLEKYYLLFFISVPLIAIFGLMEKYTVPKYIMYLPVDSYIPYIKYFVIFYFVWFIYMLVATVYFMLFSKEDFFKLLAFMAIGMALALLCFFIFPNGQRLRPADTGGGICGWLVSWLYKIDSPDNVCPSIHIINSMAVHICIVKSKLFCKNKLIKGASFITMVLINLSTVFIKQHSVLDVMAGFLFVIAVYAIVFGIIFKRGQTGSANRETAAAN